MVKGSGKKYKTCGYGGKIILKIIKKSIDIMKQKGYNSLVKIKGQAPGKRYKDEKRNVDRNP